SIAGVATNIVNMVIFLKLGLKDSMSVGLLALSFTDLSVTAIQLAGCSSYLVNVIYPESPIDPWSLGAFVFSWARYITYLISCWITTMISAERCFCVVSPFTVKRVFTKTRCVCVILTIYLVHFGIHLPIFLYAKMEWTRKAIAENTTILGRSVLTVVFNDDSAMWEILSDLIAGVGLSVLSQVLLVVCTFWMTYSLKVSSRIRSNTSTVSGDSVSKLSDIASRKPDNNLSDRERRLVKVVLFLAVILTVCNIPRFLTTTVHHILPGMNLGAYKNLDTLLWEVSYIFGTICCTSNIVVYLQLNSSYRKMFKKIFI
ncbi:unnamed protein product, partial [Lymnaea stagnalis]